MNYNGEWGTVCDDGWSYYNTYVVCRQLGLGTYGYYGYYYGQGSGPIWLDNVICTGSELTLANCGHLGFNVTRSCSHYEDEGIRCYGTRGISLYKQNYWRTLYLAVCSKNAVEKILKWRF